MSSYLRADGIEDQVLWGCILFGIGVVLSIVDTVSIVGIRKSNSDAGHLEEYALLQAAEKVG